LGLKGFVVVVVVGIYKKSSKNTLSQLNSEDHKSSSEIASYAAD